MFLPVPPPQTHCHLLPRLRRPSPTSATSRLHPTQIPRIFDRDIANPLPSAFSPSCLRYSPPPSHSTSATSRQPGRIWSMAAWIVHGGGGRRPRVHPRSPSTGTRWRRGQRQTRPTFPLPHTARSRRRRVPSPPSRGMSCGGGKEGQW